MITSKQALEAFSEYRHWAWLNWTGMDTSPMDDREADNNARIVFDFISQSVDQIEEDRF